MTDGAVRRALKRLAVWHFELNVRATRRLRGPAPYVLGGECRRCAGCCEAPAIQAGRALWSLALLRRPFLWWQEKVNGFVLVERDAPDRLFVFRCTHFDAARRSCDSYLSRPGMCRDYPRALLDQPDPQMLAGCGYRPVLRGSARLLRVLEAQPLTAEQRERLRSGLRLEERDAVPPTR